jgi:putative chitinase
MATDLENSLLTGPKLKLICPTLSMSRAIKLADSMKKVLPIYGMYNEAVLPEFIAQLAHESIEFSAKEENLNYSAEALVRTWPSRFVLRKDSKDSAKRIAEDYAHKPREIANAAYNGRMSNALGSDDGWNFRGSGFMQNTGKDSILPYLIFKKQGKGYKFDKVPGDLFSIVGLLRTDDEWALDAACWEFAISKGLIDEAEKGDMITITKKINGGLIGLASRMMYYKRALNVFT